MRARGEAIQTGRQIEARRYRIVSVLGKGGSGKVYKAVLEGAGGFHKDVALKLLRDEDLPEPMLVRFRDEARILGLVRDRAIVSVEPPVRLSGKWAIVMEFVDGASVQRLLSMGPMPAAVAAEITGEVARVLDKVYRMAGPDGEPLRILHRDVKPANLQITADGEIRVLDFGLAKSDFAAREAQAGAYSAGTKGFVAPERIEGVDTPAGDVFSLGVTLHCMITGEKPSRRQQMGMEDPPTQNMGPDAVALVSLAARMRSNDPKERPTSREVEEACARVRRKSDGVSLKDWASKNVPRAVALKFSDELVGTVLSEVGAEPTAEPAPNQARRPASRAPTSKVPSSREATASTRAQREAAREQMAMSLMETRLDSEPGEDTVSVDAASFAAMMAETRVERLRRDDDAPPPPSAEAPTEHRGSGMWMGLAAMGTMLGAILGLLTVGALGGLFLLGSTLLQPAPRRVVPPPVPLAIVPPPPLPPMPKSALDPLPGELVTPELAPQVAIAEPAPQPAPPPKPTKASKAAPPEPVEPPPPPIPGAPTRLVTFSSIPLGADVYVDGDRLGQTPLVGVALTDGGHQIKIISDAETLIRNIDVGKKLPSRYVWKGGDRWELH